MDERTERRVLEKAEYVGEAIKVLVKKRDSLSFEEYRASGNNETSSNESSKRR